MLLLGLVVVGTATAARKCMPCHPDPYGTVRLTVAGRVDRYEVEGALVRVDYHLDTGCAGSYLWDLGRAAPKTSIRSCSGTERELPVRLPESTLTAADGALAARVVRPPASVDAPDRLEVRVRATGTVLHRWPVIDRPTSLDVYGDLAVYTASGGGFYVVDLTRGRNALVAPNRPGDSPQLGPFGVVFRDNLQKGRQRPAGTILKAFPLAAVVNAVVTVGRPLHTTAIRSFSMDGPRVAAAVADRKGRCDRIIFWNIPWRFASRLTQPIGPMCIQTAALTVISRVAIAGSRAEWIASSKDRRSLFAADIVNCKEWRVASLATGAAGDEVAGLAGDGAVLSWAIIRHERELRGASMVGNVPQDWRATTLASGGSTPVGVSADSRRVATLRSDGTIDVQELDGTPLVTLHAPAARAIALRQTLVAALVHDTLEIFDVGSGKRLGQFTVPRGTEAIDLHFGIAVFAVGRTVYALDVHTGDSAILAQAPALVHAQIDDAGVAYQYNVGRRGVVRFIPLRTLDRALA